MSEEDVVTQQLYVPADATRHERDAETLDRAEQALQEGDERGERHSLEPARREDPRADIDEPGRLIRIAATVQSLLQEVEVTQLDEAARERLTRIHNRTIETLRDAVSEELQDELQQLSLEPASGTPTGAELRVMQAQLSGWLQGLFHGIQASIANQQLAAQQQLARVREQGQVSAGAGAGSPTGQYL